ncbi:hypothetical protein TNCV_2658711 [Trichonephila clavipes]|nr:hypothetical protein TNCV_2658711 [Trichonephila clavipes]
MELKGGKYSPVPCALDLAYKTFGPTDLTSTYSECTRRVFGASGIEPRPSDLESGALITRLLTAHVALCPNIQISNYSVSLLNTEHGHGYYDDNNAKILGTFDIIVKVGITFQDGDRFNSCEVIHSQFGLAIHQNDHQARRRVVEWAQNEIAVVPDFHKRILFSDEAHFWLNGYVNKQNCRIWSEANPQVYVETLLHPEKLTVWCALWAGGILLQKR